MARRLRYEVNRLRMDPCNAVSMVVEGILLANKGEPGDLQAAVLMLFLAFGSPADLEMLESGRKLLQPVLA